MPLSKTSSAAHRVIHIEPGAPRKPAEGAACNGCGWCCLAETCPLGVVLSGSRRGPCKALRWDGLAAQYRCAAVAMPVLGRLARRWIAAGAGCDSSLEVDESITMPAPPDKEPA